MKLISNCEKLPVIKGRGYGGATGSKVAVWYNDAVWMLKRGQTLKKYRYA